MLEADTVVTGKSMMKNNRQVKQSRRCLIDGIDAVFAHKSFCLLYYLVNLHFLLFLASNADTRCNYWVSGFRHNF